jgi:hypothetical protein
MLLLPRNICIAISFNLVVLATFGQDPGKTPPEKDVFTPSMANKTFNQRLIANLADKVPETKNVTVSWSVSRYGYVATYVIENVPYLTLYSTAGEFVESFRKLPWDDRVPEVIRMEFDNSEYNSFTVMGFWESVRKSNKHYFFQMQDKQSVSWNAWCDENGKFSKVPFIE